MLTQFDRWRKSERACAPEPPWAQELLSRAVGLLHEALAIDLEHAPAHHHLGCALTALGDVDGALSAYHAAIAANPQHANAHSGLACILLNELGDWAGAEAAFRAAVAADPQHLAAHVGLGFVLKKRGDLAGAETAYRAAGRVVRLPAPARDAGWEFSADPQLAEAHFTLGCTLGVSGDYAGAAACFAKVVQIDPSNSSAQQNLTHALKAVRQSRS